jgi:hypothetical protein
VLQRGDRDDVQEDLMFGLAASFGARFLLGKVAPDLLESGPGKFLLGGLFRTALTGLGVDKLLGHHQSAATQQLQQYRGGAPQGGQPQNPNFTF